MPRGSEALVRDLAAAAYRVPTDAPEADGTFAWDSTTLALVRIEAAGESGIGYTYCSEAAASLISAGLRKLVVGRDAFDIPAIWCSMQRQVRNSGRSGIAACAISAVDTALWDLKAKLLGVPLANLLGRCRDAIPVYGSGGFTSYSDARLREQLANWVEHERCRFVKMKIGTEPQRDPQRIAVAKVAIGDRELFVDANGAFSARQALALAGACREADIRWFEEPVTSDDLVGLRCVRDGVGGAVDVAAGEYVFTLDDARRLLEAGAVDVLQADVTRCGGITGLLQVGGLCEAHHTDLSGHCAPALHLAVACAVPRMRHLEWFHDHVRIEHMLFDGAPHVRDGMIAPDLDRPGHGLTFKESDARQFRIAPGGAA